MADFYGDQDMLKRFRQAADSARFYENQTDTAVFDDPRFKHFAETGEYRPSSQAFPDEEIHGANFGQGRAAFPDPRRTQSDVSGAVAQSTTQYPVQPFPNQLGMIQSTPRNTALYDALLARSKQTLALGPNDPIIQPQVDAYRAEQTRARRDYLADSAERRGQFANMAGEERLTSERLGQNVGGFQAQLMGRELESRRNEILMALQQMGAQGTEEERLALNRELGLLELALQQQRQTSDTSMRQSELELALQRLGLEAEQQSSYWDWVRRGGFSG